jgi:Zn-dependent peptidase ImmA (M78 family)
VNSKKSKIIFHPKYYSQDRRACITFDVAIETRLNKKDKKPCLLTLIECKYYSSTISVDDIEEFVSKVHQVSRLNVKAIFVTNSTFQRAALAYGVANEIGMARFIPGKSFIWESKRTTPIEKNQISNFVQEYVTACLLGQIECSNNFVGSFNGMYTTDIYVYLHNFGCINSYYELSNISNFAFKANYLSCDKIEDTAEEIVRKFWSNFDGCDRIEMLIHGITHLYGITIIENKHLGFLHDELILGKINFNTSDLFINKIIKKTDPRWIFTLAHEFSHFILHREKLRNINMEVVDNEFTLNDSSIAIDNKSFSQFEWQANSLAACILLPKTEFINKVTSIYEKNYITKLPLYLDSQPVNRQLCNKIIYEISNYFKCSGQVVFIRLKEFKLLSDQTKSPIKDVLSDYFIGLSTQTTLSFQEH